MATKDIASKSETDVSCWKFCESLGGVSLFIERDFLHGVSRVSIKRAPFSTLQNTNAVKMAKYTHLKIL